MRYFLHLSYRGTHYHGWQKQPAHPSVQETLEAVLRRVLREQVFLVGCGRTDAGVHASQYFLHLDTEKPITEVHLERAQLSLPSDICLYEAIPMGERSHARFDAYARTYDYFGHFRKDVLLDGWSAHYPQYAAKGLDFARMQQAVDLLTRYRDYRAFCRKPDKNEHNRCTISEAQLFVHPTGDRFRLQLTSNRFLKGMVRIIVRKLILIGSGKMSVDAFEEQLVTGQNPMVYIGAYPQGLYLSGVRYPTLERPVAAEGFLLLRGEGESRWLPV